MVWRSGVQSHFNDYNFTIRFIKNVCSWIRLSIFSLHYLCVLTLDFVTSLQQSRHYSTVFVNLTILMLQTICPENNVKQFFQEPAVFFIRLLNAWHYGILKIHYTCFPEIMTLVAICSLHRIVGTNLTTESSVCQRQQQSKFCLRPGVLVRARCA